MYLITIITKDYKEKVCCDDWETTNEYLKNAFNNLGSNLKGYNIEYKSNFNA